MKKVLIILSLIGVFSASYSYTCSGAAYYDIQRGYVIKSNKVFYQYSYKSTQVNNNKKEIISKEEENKEIPGVDTASFKQINSYIGMDKNNIYYGSKVIGKSEGFESLGAYYTYKACTSAKENYMIKNSEKVFINDKVIDLDAKTTEVLYLDTKQDSETGFTIMNLYAQDKNGVYYYSTFSDSMVKLLNFTLKDSEFRVLRNKNNAQYFVTPYKVFLNGKDVKGADTKTFQIIEDSNLALSKDKSSYFKDTTMISKSEFDEYRKAK